MQLNRYTRIAEENFMDIRLKRTAAFVMLVVGMTSAFADPDYRREERGAARAAQQEQRALAREARLSEKNAEEDNYSNTGRDANNKHRKLSPEERRALRRQIDEAGQDIYTRKH